jgi:hypothetical protein
MYTACTEEMDDPELAVMEIVSKLALKTRLMRNAVGIIACDYEFIETGVVQALSRALPFEVAGCTTLSSAAQGISGAEILCISVLTSDDVRFAAALSPPLNMDDIDIPVRRTFEEARGALGQAPDFMLAYLPFIPDRSGSLILRALDAASGGVPVFGGLSCAQVPNFTEGWAIHNEASRNGAAALVLMAGNVRPRFFVNSIPESALPEERGVITDAEGFIIKKINNVTFAEYIKKIGLREMLSQAIPLVVNSGSGSIALGVQSITKEGYAVCSMEPPENAHVALGQVERRRLLEAAEEATKTLLEVTDGQGILIHLCLARSLLFGTNTQAEMRLVMEMIGDTRPCQISYSAGELCPVLDERHAARNRLHNYAYIACVL